MYISYSGYKTHEECPRAYYFGYIGKPPLPKPDNRVNMLFGQVVGELFEQFYVDKLWKLPNVAEHMEGLAEPTLTKTILHETTTARNKGVIRWKGEDRKANYLSKEDVLADVKKAIPRGIAIIKAYRLLGVDAKAEMKLDSIFSGHMLGGRADFVMRRTAPHNDLIIIDGKGSKHREKFVSEKQLLWYAMLHRQQTGVLPSALGFLYWRYEPDEAMDWVTVNPERVDEFQAKVVSTVNAIDQAQRRLPIVMDTAALAKEFPAKPEQKTCEFCSYQPLCDEAQEYFKAKASNAAAKAKARMGLPTSGVTDFGTDGIGLDD